LLELKPVAIHVMALTNQPSAKPPRTGIYRVRINYRRILQNYIFTTIEQKNMMLLPFERVMFAVS
jgi:hypothetical protein